MGCAGSTEVGAGGAGGAKRSGSRGPVDDLIAQATNELDLSQPELASEPARFDALLELPPKVAALTQLEVLRIKKNQLIELPETIAAMTRLRVLDVSENKLRALPAGVGALTGLLDLDISENEIETLPAEIGKCTRLERFIAFKNLLKVLPAEIGDCAALAEVNFFNNRLGRLPPSMAQLKHLDDLNLAGNKLKAITFDISNWASLKRLAIFRNNIVMMPSLAPLVNLEQLQINNIMLSEFPEMGSMPALQLLDANTGQFTALPATIGEMTSLTNINCRGCKITVVPAALGKLQNLETLNLGKNQITELPAQLGECAALKIAFFDENEGLSRIPGSFASLGNLVRVNFLGCGIDTGDEETAASVSRISEVTAANGGWIKVAA